MSNEFSIFARFKSIDPLYSTLDTALQQSNLTWVEVLSLLRWGFSDSQKFELRKEGMKRGKSEKNLRWGKIKLLDWSGKKNAERAELLPFPSSRNRYFSIPLSSHIFQFSRRFKTGGATARERCVNWFDWAFSISFPTLQCGPLSSLPACRISFFSLKIRRGVSAVPN